MSTTNTFSPSYHTKYGSRFLNGIEKGSKIVIAGAGCFGGWTGLLLQEAGFDVTVVDPWGPGNSRSSSGGETRLIRCIYGDNEWYTKMCMRSFDLWRVYESKFQQKLLFDLPTWWFCGNDDEFLDPAYDLMDKLQLPYQKLSCEEARKLRPEINYIDIQNVLVEEMSGYLLAKEGSISVMNYFRKLGGKYIASACLLEEQGNKHIEKIQLENGSGIGCDLFIAACGPWMNKLFPSLNRLFTVTRQEVLYFGQPPGSFIDFPNWVDGTGSEYFYGLPQGSNRGFKIALDKHGVEIDPTRHERIPDQDYIHTCREFLGHRFPLLKNAPLIEHRICQYTNTPDGNFIFDKHPHIENCWLLGGGSGHGYKHGPALGEKVANILTGKEAIEPLFELSRFQ